MKSLQANLSILLISLVLGLGIAEVGLRLWGFTYPTFLQADPVTGHAHRPGVEGLYQDEGRAYVRTNSAGLRDLEHVTAKPTKTLRVAVLGDSFAEALQVPLEATFWKQLERHLSRCDRAGGKRVEVINFGVSGYGTAQELLTLRHRVWVYAPDVVLLAFTTGNDMQDNSRTLSDSYARPYFDRQLRADNGFLDSKAYKLKDSAPWRLMIAASDYSRALQLFNMVIRRTAQKGAAPGGVGELGFNDRIYLPPADEAWREAWDVTEALVLQIAKEVADKRARFFVATLSNGIQVSPDAQAREHYRERVGAEDLFYPDRRAGQLLSANGIPHVLLAPELARIAQAGKIYMHGFPDSPRGLGLGHWNEDGHRFAGALIAPHLCQAL